MSHSQQLDTARTLKISELTPTIDGQPVEISTGRVSGVVMTDPRIDPKSVPGLSNERAEELLDEMVRDALAKQKERDRAEELGVSGSDRHSSTIVAKRIWRDTKRALKPRARKKRT